MRFGEFIREFSEESYERMVDILNTGLTKLTIDENISGETVEVFLPAGVEVDVVHTLKEVPKYRIILRQSGAGIIEDGITEWTDRYIYLTSTIDTTIKVLILRG